MRAISVTTTLENILEGHIRLDATYYATDVFQAKQILENYESAGNEVLSVGHFSNGTYNPPPIKRVFTDDAAKGTPYMLPQEMFDFYWSPKKHVLAHKMSKIEDWYLKEGWVVLTQSGSVGKPYFATASDEKNILSQNAIRIPPIDKERGGFIYAYLSTWIGQTLLKKDEFGITVKHIRPHQVDEIPIPNIPSELQEEISLKIKSAFELRQKAIDLINEAKAMIYNELNAPHANIFDDEEVEES